MFQPASIRLITPESGWGYPHPSPMLAVEPATGDGAFLGPMIERLADSCQRLGRPLADCQPALIAYKADEASGFATPSVLQDLLQ
jgi:adenine-specific DNA-methyltransferase